MSNRTKDRRVAELDECGLQKLLLASAKAAKETGEKDMEYVLKLLYNNHEVAKKIRDLLKVQDPYPQKIDPSRGLNHLLDNRLSKEQYTRTRLLAKEYKADIFPPYNKIREAKKECRPPAECLRISDVSAILPLQALLDHTAYRLLLLQEEVIETLKVTNNKITVKLQVKWGSDGSSDQSQFNQKYVESTESTDANSDASLFATTLVPLRMTTNCRKIIWNNATPSSSRWCRPLRLQFAKETPELTLTEIQSVEEEIRLLATYNTTIAGKMITVMYELYLTMIDGKVHTVLKHTKSSQACTICGAVPKQFNILENLKNRFKPKEGTLKYGVSVMHLWIRSFEWLLNISYRVKVEKWYMRGKVLKAEVKKRKRKLQRRFWKQMNLRVAFPSKKGGGNSNSGPVTRKAFSDPEKLATILELNVELIKRVRIILIALSSQLPLDEEMFPNFCEETARFYVSKYYWYPMPQSIHTILIHARDLILANDLPLGVLAEDAAESCNKLYRHNRQFHARNVSRQQNLTDVFNRALDTSDPIISSFALQKRLNSRTRRDIPIEVLRLIKAPDAPESNEPLLLQDCNDNDEIFDRSPLDEFYDSLDELNLPENPVLCDDDENYEDDDSSSDDDNDASWGDNNDSSSDDDYDM